MSLVWTAAQRCSVRLLVWSVSDARFRPCWDLWPGDLCLRLDIASCLRRRLAIGMGDMEDGDAPRSSGTRVEGTPVVATDVAKRAADRDRMRRRRMAYTPSQRAAEQEKNRTRNALRRAAGVYVRGPARKKSRIVGPAAADDAANVQRTAAARLAPVGRDGLGIGPVCLTEPEAQRLDAGHLLSSMCPERAELLYERCRRALGYYGEGGELVCLVCQQLTLVRRCKVLYLRQLPLANMRARLTPAVDLPAGLIAEYDLSRDYADLAGMLLSPLGVVTRPQTLRRLEARFDMVDDEAHSSCPSAGSDAGVSDEARFVMCKTCYRSLRRPGSNKMPKLSLANSNATGLLPASLPRLSRVEVNLVALVAVKAGLVVLSGGQQRALQGHAYFYDIGTSPAATRLPRVVGSSAADGVLRVVFAGHRTPAAVIASRRIVNARRGVVEDALRFLLDNNTLYSGVQIDKDALSRLSSEPDGEPPEGIIVGRLGDDSSAVNADVTRARSDVAGTVDHEPSADDPGVADQLSLSSSAMVNMTPASTGQRERTAFDNVFVVRRGGPIVADRAAGTVTGCFPDLFPYGRGGPEERRAVPMSLAVYFRRLMLDGRRHFAQHALLPLLAFDIVGRAAMMSKGALHVRMRPSTHAAIAGVTVDELREHLVGKERERVSRRRGEAARRQNVGDPSSILMNQVYATMSRFPWSNEERATWRQELYALWQCFGVPHVFFTVTPDDVNSLTVMYYAGAVDADVFFDTNASDIPSRGERFRIVSKDPVADARFFSRILGVVVRELLGWDSVTRRPVAGGGIFGVTKAFFGVVETQGRGALHAHNLVWVHGMPPTVDMVKDALESSTDFKQRFQVWSNTCSVASLPLSHVAVRCPVCGGPMDKRTMPESSKSLAGKYAKEAHVATCRERLCDGRATSTEILRQQVADATAGGSEGEDGGGPCVPVRCDNPMDPRYDYPPPEVGGAASAARVEAEKLSLFSGRPILSPWSVAGGYVSGGLALVQQLLCRVQLHSWKHVASCFKKGAGAKKGCCRYLFPRSPDVGGVQSGAFSPRRPLGCEYLNPYNLLLSVVCRCNVDVRVLFNTQARAVVYYIVKYATKAQQEIEPGTVDVLSHFEKKLIAEKAAGGTNHVDKATRRVLSVAYNSSSRMQIPAPLASMLLLGQPGKICSHTFGFLMLVQAIQRFEGEPISGILRVQRVPATFDEGGDVSAQPSGVRAELRPMAGSGTSGRRAVVVDSYTEYSCRPTSLQGMNWYTYVAEWTQTRLPQSVAGTPMQDDSESGFESSSDCEAGGIQHLRKPTAPLRYSSDHPLYLTHGVKRRAVRCVPRIFGPRLPDQDALDEDSDKERFGMLALILFSPWRSRDDILSTGTSYWDSYVTFDFDAASELQMEIMQSWYNAKNEADAEAAAQADAGGGDFGDDENSCDEGDLGGNAEDVGDGVRDTRPLDFAAAIHAADGVSDQASVGDVCGPPNDPLVLRFFATGAIGILSDAVCRGAAIVGQVASAAASAWTRMVSAVANEHATGHAPVDESTQAVSCVLDRINSSVVEKQAAELCARIRAGGDETGKADCAEEAGVGCNGVGDSTGRTTVEALRAALEDVRMRDVPAGFVARDVEAVPRGLSIGSVGSIFTLNRLQMTAFTILALAIGRSMVQDLEEARCDDASMGVRGTSSKKQPDSGRDGDVWSAGQLLFYLGGEGGTGKTRVIDALSFFCRSWGRPRAVLNAAFTGLAASAIGGSTLHSLVQLSGKGQRSSAAPTAQQCENFRGTLMIVVDEVSMVSSEQLAETEGRLRLLMERDEDFGGLHVCLAGDFFQMPPIGAPFLFVDTVAAYEASILRRRAAVAARVAAVRGTTAVACHPADSEHAEVLASDHGCGVNVDVVPAGKGDGAAVGSARGGDAGGVLLTTRMHLQRRGYHLWRLFSTVIILTENVRQSRDPAFQRMVKDIRRGRWTDESITLLNTRVLAETHSREKEGHRETAVVVYTNASRLHVTRLLLGGAARGMPRRVVRLYAVVRPAGRAMTVVEQHALLNMPSQATGELEMVLDVYCGLPVLVTKNLATELGIANGSRATVEGVQFPVGSAFRELVIDGGGVVLLPSAPAEVIWIRVEGRGALCPRLPCVPDSAGSGVFPVTMAKFRGRIKLPKEAGAAVVCAVVEQFPLTPAFVMTPYKLQGRTVPMLCIPAWPSSRCPSCTAYLILSRPKALNQLMLLLPLTRASVQKFAPSRAVVVEDERLGQLCAETVRVWAPRLERAAAGDMFVGMSDTGHVVPAMGHMAAGLSSSAARSGNTHGADLPSKGAAVAVEEVEDVICVGSSTATPTVGTSLSAGDLLRGSQRLRALGRPGGRPVRSGPAGPALLSMPVAHVICELSAMEHVRLSRVMAVGVRDADPGAVVCRVAHVGDITRLDLRGFLPRGWMTGEGMFGLLVLLQRRHDRLLGAGRVIGSCAFLGPYFYTMLCSHAYSMDTRVILTHLRGTDVFAQRLIFIPMLLHGNHWVLAAVAPSEGVIIQYDSLGSHCDEVARRLSGWLEVEAARRGHVFRRPVRCIHMDCRSPQQDNQDDCGFFVVHTARLLGDGVALNFDVSVMPRLRRRLAIDLLRGCID